MAVSSLSLVDTWPARRVAVAVVTADGVAGTHGDIDAVYPLASVTKLLVTLAILVAVEEGSVDLDAPAGPDGSTIRHLLAHASGLPYEGSVPIAPAGARRIYSNTGFEVLTAAVERSTGIVMRDYLHEAVVGPLGLRSTALAGSPASGASSSVHDLAVVAAELLDPALVDRTTLAEATRVAFPGLAGVLPGFGQQDPNDWGLGFELRDDKRPHWTGATNTAATFGHFGRAGTFLWVDPGHGIALACLTDEAFDQWAMRAWPALSESVVAELSR
jgi:CubicO group peptidase (beta-lactamase class C family)